MSWTQQTTPTTDNNKWRAITYSPELGLFCAVGTVNSGVSANRIMTSPDGVTWTVRAAPSSSYSLFGVAWSPSLGLFVATGSANLITTSPDGITWTAQTGPTGANNGNNVWNNVIWSPGLSLFIAANNRGTGTAPAASHNLMTSPDGINWTGRNVVSKSDSTTTNGFGAPQMVDCPSLGTVILVGFIGSTRNIFTSTTGTTFTYRASDSSTGANSGSDECWVTWSPTLSLAACVLGRGDNPIYTSPDGANWTQRTAPTTGANRPIWKQLVWFVDKFVGVALAGTTNTNQIIQSSDGTTWTESDPAVATVEPWNFLAASANGLVAVASNATNDGKSVMTQISALTVTAISPSVGVASGGTHVTITGTLFVAGAIANIGGTACTNMVVINDTTITCTTGAHAVGLCDVTVTLPSFAFATLTGGFTYITDFSSASAFVISAGDHGPMAGGTLVTITGTFFAVGVVVLFDGTPATSITVPNSTTVTCLTPPHQAGVVDVTIGTYTLTGGFTYDLYPTLSYPIPSNIQYAPAMRIEDVLNDSPNTCRFRGLNVEPLVGRDVQFDFNDGFGLLFAGTIQTVEQIFQGKPTSLAWETTVIDYTWLLNRRVPFGTWDNVSLSTIVLELLANFSTGFSSANVQAGLPPISITLNGSKNFATCLTDMSQLTSPPCKWFVDYRKIVHFFST